MNRDYSDEQVTGLERYIPTKFSQGMLIALLTMPFASFWPILELIQRMVPMQTNETHITATVGLCLVIALVIVIAILVELSLVIQQSKHKIIFHYSTMHPNMSFLWLWRNASSKHFIFLSCILTFGVLIGSLL
ncbi:MULTISPECIES: hypothetical protein [Vibrionaceae]|nr:MULTISPECIES: hypothetical protein [Vibrionaceae]OBU47674.1 hypothetical protein AYY26_01330 [Photobacterium phosphoreum]PSU76462.1 hypothetical protein CTM67_14710 [Photobacterium phosphoreum]PTB34062.1 hypothetical protein DAT36_02600 [Photobacterium phosphoreum]